MHTTARESILVVAAHPDDEVLGCGGSLARLAAEGHEVRVLLLADGESSRLSAGSQATTELVSARNAAAEAACAELGCRSVELLSLPDNRLDTVPLLDIVQQIETRISQHRPATVFTHHAGDVNIDHRIVHDAVIAACRPTPGHSVRELMFFEIASATEWRPPASALAFTPNWFVDITSTLEAKMRALQAYASELRPFPHPRSIEAIRALARWRGASVGVDAAEAFVLGRKII